MRTIEITLGERVFGVPQQTIRAEVRWRKRAKPVVEPFGEMVMAAGISAPTPERMVKLAFTSGLFFDTGAVLELVLAYSPVLAEQQDWIGDNAYADELLQALLALFFGMTSSKRAAASGSSGAATPAT